MKKVLLYSGGLDSYVIRALEKPDVVLNIGNCGRYAPEEKARMDSEVTFDQTLNLLPFEYDSGFVPFRNLFFFLVGGLYGDKIILGATAGDRSTDKDEEFIDRVNFLMAHMNTDSRMKTFPVLFAPYINSSKIDLIKMFVAQRESEGFTADEAVAELVSQSFSCYNPVNGEQCNDCQPDVRKYLSIIEATGIDPSAIMVNKPFQNFKKERVEYWLDYEKARMRKGEGEQHVQLLEHILIDKCT